MNEFRILKKEKEKYFAELFLDVLKLPYDNISLVQNPEDPPDFIYAFNNEIIALEVTNLLSDSLVKSIENHQEKIKNSLLLKLNISELPFLEVSLFFSKSKSTFSVQIDDFSNSLFEIISNNIPDENKWLSIKNNFVGSVPYEINFIKIARFSDLDSHFISVPKFGYFTHNLIDLLQKLLDKKEKTLKNYPENYSERWLLIYDDISSGASMSLPSKETINHNYSSSFFRLFFLSTFGKNVFELNKK